ncbi:MAG: hypothetical protein LBF54_01975 [Holosporaceae bacterium]|nr:hypothetical protein [Holosporaceae bacterium]
MKIIFRTLLVISALGMIENVNAGLFSKKDQTSTDLNKTDSKVNSLSNALADASTEAEKFITKNWNNKDKNDTSVIFALRIITKNASGFFGWVRILLTALEASYDKMKSAQAALDKAKNEKATANAENDLDTAKTSLNGAIAMLLGNGVLAIRANTKTSATILLQLIKQGDFSQANVNKWKSEFSAIKKKCDEVSVDVRSLADTFKNIKEAGGDDVELDEKKLNELIDDINIFLEILSQLSTYFNKEGLEEDVIDGLLEKCSLAGGTQQKTNGSANSRDSKNPSSKSKQRGKNSQDDEDNDDDEKPRSKSKQSKNNYRNDDDDDD